MKKLLLWSVLIFVVGSVFLHGLQQKQSLANTNSFNGVIPFTTVGGLMGFFNQNDGKVYLYDGNLQNCILVSQLEELGQPIKKIK